MVKFTEYDMTLHLGDCREILADMPAASVQTCVTSPPYWGLRDYQLPPLVWGDAECEHVWGEHVSQKHQTTPTARAGRFGESGGTGRTEKPSELITIDASQGQFCQLCGAWRGSLGLEPTPELYVQHMVEIMREVRRVLRPDATLWLNLGDSYAGNRTGSTGNRSTLGGGKTTQEVAGLRPDKIAPGLKPKDLVGIPWRVAFALQADGWWLRSDIVWAKPNCMPESVRDRPTKSHEYVFLLSKRKRYYYDADAIREASQDTVGGGKKSVARRYSKDSAKNTLGRENCPIATGRNKRTVWAVATKPYKEAHFATFPPDLIRPMILAGCPVGGVVLDPFAGAGTTGVVCAELGRDFVGIELNPDYLELAKKRIAKAQQQMRLGI